MARKKYKDNYFHLDEIMECEATYNVIIGERSNGKTYAVLEHCIWDYAKNGRELAIVRRWDTDYKGKRGTNVFTGLVNNHVIEKATDGEWTSVWYWSGMWYFCRYDEKGNRERAPEPFAYAFSLNTVEHDKSTSYPNIGNIAFDEFITRSTYLVDEFVLFMNTVSTIVRDRTNVKIWMMGNTVNKYNCPYWSEMGLTHLRSMKPGDLSVYTYGETALRVAVQFSDTPAKKKPSDFYFAFDNPKLKMITGGAWELAMYPHCPMRYLPKDVVFQYFIIYEDNTLQCEIVNKYDCWFTFIHKKTTPIRDEKNDLVYSPEYNPRPNWRRKITKGTSNIEKYLNWFFKSENVFYQDNEIGEVVRSYLEWCLMDKVV